MATALNFYAVSAIFRCGKQITSVVTSNYCNYIFPHQFAYLIAVVYNCTPTSRDSVNLSQKNIGPAKAGLALMEITPLASNTVCQADTFSTLEYKQVTLVSYPLTHI